MIVSDSLRLMTDEEFMAGLLYNAFARKLAEVQKKPTFIAWNILQEEWKTAFRHAVKDVICKTADIATKAVEELERELEWEKRDNDKTPVTVRPACYYCGEYPAEQDYACVSCLRGVK